jgi:hypothetical protein
VGKLFITQIYIGIEKLIAINCSTLNLSFFSGSYTHNACQIGTKNVMPKNAKNFVRFVCQKNKNSAGTSENPFKIRGYKKMSAFNKREDLFL